jgi:5-(carboxyamino)imidazole ribonucleotide mutase
MGSESDLPVMRGAADVLKEFEVPFEIRVLSAHRTPNESAAFSETAYDRGIRVIIAAAGGAAHLGGVLAAYTPLPVIGVPIPSKDLKGIDSLLSIVQMPSGVPVASVAIGGSKNAALLAIQILATSDDSLLEKMKAFKDTMVGKVQLMDKRVNAEIFG